MKKDRNISRLRKMAVVGPLATAILATGTIAGVAPGAVASTNDRHEASAPPHPSWFARLDTKVTNTLDTPLLLRWFNVYEGNVERQPPGHISPGGTGDLLISDLLRSSAKLKYQIDTDFFVLISLTTGPKGSAEIVDEWFTPRPDSPYNVTYERTADNWNPMPHVTLSKK